MQIIPTPIPATSLVTVAVREIAAFYPAPLQRDIEAALPTMALEAVQLAAEVMLAEQMGLPFARAVTHPRHTRMEQVFFGISNALQWRLTKPMQIAIGAMLRHSVGGGFDRLRRQIFTTARRSDGPEPALCRFFLWVAVRLNLLVLTWAVPAVEAAGTLDEMDTKAETVLRELLQVADMEEPDVRPLHVLVAEMFLHMAASTKRKLREALREYGEELAELQTNAEAVAQVRTLDAADAVLFAPGRFSGAPGSTQIARRYPQHFACANALEQRRHRLRTQHTKPKQVSDNTRLIELVRNASGGA